MVYKAKRVAVIGAGVSGLTSAKHLKDAGLEVVVYERSSTVGGVWSYDERQPFDPKYPSILPSEADFLDSTEDGDLDREGVRGPSQEKEAVDLRRAPPGPAYDGLTNNISTVLQELKGYPWPEGTPDFVNVRVKGAYLQGYAKHFDLEPLIKYNTRVEKLEKTGNKWALHSTTLVKEASDSWQLNEEVEEFDAVVVASGHYHASKVPDIPGLKEWKAAWPDKVQHSKRYRRPEGFKDQNVLLIGAGVSSTDIAREITNIAKSVYQSSRGSPYDIPLAFLPVHTERVAEVASFAPPAAGQTTPGPITLVDGRVLTGIDRVVICTGYHFSYPFLRALHADTTAGPDASERVLVTADGAQTHNLHRDIFYIPDPTLAFVGVPFYTATFTLFEFQAIAVAAVLSGRAWLPREEEMREEYRRRLEAKGYGRAFHSLRDGEVEYVTALVAWVNAQAEVTGGDKVEAHSERWLRESELRMAKMKKLFEPREASDRVAKDDEKAKEFWHLD